MYAADESGSQTKGLLLLHRLLICNMNGDDSVATTMPPGSGWLTGCRARKRETETERNRYGGFVCFEGTAAMHCYPL